MKRKKRETNKETNTKIWTLKLASSGSSSDGTDSQSEPKPTDWKQHLEEFKERTLKVYGVMMKLLTTIVDDTLRRGLEEDVGMLQTAINRMTPERFDRYSALILKMADRAYEQLQ